MTFMRQGWSATLALIAVMTTAASPSAQPRAPGARAPEVQTHDKFRPAPPEVVAELRQALDEAIRRFNAKETSGVLAYVSDHYRTGDITKAGIAEQLRAFFAVNEQVDARVRIDAALLVGDTAWVYTSGDVSGRPRWLRSMIPMLSWQRELEIARREAGGWRLIGDRQ